MLEGLLRAAEVKHDAGTSGARSDVSNLFSIIKCTIRN